MTKKNFFSSSSKMAMRKITSLIVPDHARSACRMYIDVTASTSLNFQASANIAIMRWRWCSHMARGIRQRARAANSTLAKRPSRLHHANEQCIP
jgi:hypothetical protein